MIGGIGGQGIVEVQGNGSHWSNIGPLYVDGTLRILAGGKVSDNNSRIGNGTAPDIAAAALVSGIGSQWRNSGGLAVGYARRGILTITAGGLVKVGDTLSIYDGFPPIQATSFLNIATGGMLALAGEADDSLTQFLNLVSGTDAIRYWDASLSDWAPLTAATYGTDYTLEYLTTGDLAGYTLLTVGRVGDFDNDGDVDGRDFLAWQRHPELGSLVDWQNAYGGDSALRLSPSALNVAVPEPSCFALLLGLMFLSGRVRKDPP